MRQQFLDIEVKLLLAKYGRREVVKCLAGISSASVDEIEAELRRVARLDRADKHSKSNHEVSVIDEVCAGRPDVKEVLERLSLFYDGRGFLPELRDVQGFLEQHGVAARPRSRKTALPAVLRTLAMLSSSELRNLCDQVTRIQGTSEFALLANGLMGNGKH